MVAALPFMTLLQAAAWTLERRTDLKDWVAVAETDEIEAALGGVVLEDGLHEMVACGRALFQLLPAVFSLCKVRDSA